MKAKQMVVVAAIVAATAGVSGCASMSSTQQRTLSGAAIGAAGGALIDGSTGALIGAGVGAASGYLWDQHKQSEQRAYEQGKRDASQGK